MRVKTHVKAGKGGTTMLREHRPVPQRPDDAASPPQPSQEAVGEGRGLDPLDDTVRLHDLAVSRQAEGRLQEAVPLCRQALALVERAVGPHHPDVANILDTLTGIYEDLGDYAEAVRLSQRSVAMMEEVTGSIEMEVLRVQSLCTLAGIYRVQGRSSEAERLYRRALTIKEKVLGPNHADMAMTLYNLAVLYKNAGEYEKKVQTFSSRSAA
jgi:tetratricopeptide (TPR) repeat protein